MKKNASRTKSSRERDRNRKLSDWHFVGVSAARSRNMAAIRSRDTSPEHVVRSTLRKMGIPFRLHVRKLPGCPDIVLPQRRVALFVHGCFWHAHRCKIGRRIPKTNVAYWIAKRARNKQRDGRSRRALRRAGWRVLTIWECETRQVARISEKLRDFFSS